jgi:hypothetical protein
VSALFRLAIGALVVVAAAIVVTLVVGRGSARADGSFTTNDPLLTKIWSVSVKSARDMVVSGPLTADALGRPCPIDLKTVIVDGAQRDRCPYVGDLAVTGKTLLISTPSAVRVLRSMIVWFAAAQHADGAIPAGAIFRARRVLVDYNAYWVEDVHDFVLSTGDLSLARQVWPNLVKLMNRWYPAQLGRRGLLVNHLGASDYAAIHRYGTTIAYYNAGYGRALLEAAALATWLGHPRAATAWRARWAALKAVFNTTFWDVEAGAYLDSPTGPGVHPEDGNAFGILAGFASPAREQSALDFLTATIKRSYGNALLDVDAWSYPNWGGFSNLHVSPFIGYFEVLARYAAGVDDSALELTRREWGYMVANGPHRGMWEDIGPNGGGPTNTHGQSWNHGWSSGAAPALTGYVLGIRPGSPGFGTFIAEPHPSDLEWARGKVPTPKGLLRVKWSHTPIKFKIEVNSPVPGTIVLPLAGHVRVFIDGASVRSPMRGRRPTVIVTAGRHTAEVDVLA